MHFLHTVRAQGSQYDFGEVFQLLRLGWIEAGESAFAYFLGVSRFELVHDLVTVVDKAGQCSPGIVPVLGPGGSLLLFQSGHDARQMRGCNAGVQGPSGHVQFVVLTCRQAP